MSFAALNLSSGSVSRLITTTPATALAISRPILNSLFVTRSFARLSSNIWRAYNPRLAAQVLPFSFL